MVIWVKAALHTSILGSEASPVPPSTGESNPAAASQTGGGTPVAGVFARLAGPDHLPALQDGGGVRGQGGRCGHLKERRARGLGLTESIKAGVSSSGSGTTAPIATSVARCLAPHVRTKTAHSGLARVGMIEAHRDVVRSAHIPITGSMRPVAEGCSPSCKHSGGGKRAAQTC